MKPILTVDSSRLFKFPQQRLFEAFSDPEQLVQWWGPEGFSSTIHEFDLRPGGAFRLTLHGPNGTDYENDKRFTEVVVPEKVAFHHVQPIHDFTMSMTFAPEEESTRLAWHMEFFSGEGGEKLHDFIANANEQNFDRLEAFLSANS